MQTFLFTAPFLSKCSHRIASFLSIFFDALKYHQKDLGSPAFSFLFVYTGSLPRMRRCVHAFEQLSQNSGFEVLRANYQ